jgi:NAD+ synthase (glutamine-hydrolysing)
MPTRFNSKRTQANAAQLAANLGISYAITPIEELFESTLKFIGDTVFTRQDESHSKTRVPITALIKENIQARHRGATILSALSAGLGAIYTNNGNKTETALGYATLYGDVNGALAPIADLYKGEVYALARHMNNVVSCELIPEDIFTVVPSAELSADQNVDEGKGDPIIYPYHDKLIRAFVEFRKEPEDILELYLTEKLEDKILIPKGTIAKNFATPAEFIRDLEEKWRLFNTSIFKRIQAPPIITVSKRAFGFDLRESQNGVHFTQRFQELKENVLSS